VKCTEYGQGTSRRTQSAELLHLGVAVNKFRENEETKSSGMY